MKKLNKKMVNALIGFTGFTLISSFSSCKCSGVSLDEPGITSELASEDESIIISDNSELTSEVTSENVTSETNTELTSESNTEELGNGNESGNGASELGSGNSDNKLDDNEEDIFGEEFYNVYRDDITEEQIEKNTKIIDEYRSLYSYDLSDKQKEKYYKAFLDTYDMNKIIDICDKYRFNEFIFKNVPKYMVINNLFMYCRNDSIRIYYLDEDNNPLFFITQYALEDEEIDYSYAVLDDAFIHDIYIGTNTAGLDLADKYTHYEIDNAYAYSDDVTVEYKEYLKSKVLVKKMK